MRQTVEQRTADHREQRFLQFDRNNAEQGDRRPADDITQTDDDQTDYCRRCRFFPERRQIDLFVDGGTDEAGLTKSDNTSSEHKPSAVEKTSRRSRSAATAAPVYRAPLHSTTANREPRNIFRYCSVGTRLYCFCFTGVRRTAGSQDRGQTGDHMMDSGRLSIFQPA